MARKPRRPARHREPTVFSRWLYYLTSVPTLLRGIQNLPVLLPLLRNKRPAAPLILRDGTRYWVRNLMDVWIVKETNLDRQYEQYGVPVEDGWHVVDVGAGLGDFAVHAARRSPHGSVAAYEPYPESAALLRQNLLANGIQNARAYQNAVASEAGEVSLAVDGDFAVRYHTAGQHGGAGTPAVSVQSVTLPSILAGLPEGRCDLLKMDCEGAEFDILLNLDGDSLRRIGRICLEYHDSASPYSHRDLLGFLAERGWKTYASRSPVHGDLGFLYAENPRAWESAPPEAVAGSMVT